jgi:hypothetical protein
LPLKATKQGFYDSDDDTITAMISASVSRTPDRPPSITHSFFSKLTRSGEMLFYPLDGQYVVFPGSIYATYLIDADCPNPCRKYHISSAVTCGHAVANIVLPILRETNTHHKIVRDWQSLLRQTDGDFADQAGKFITVYMRPGVGFRNALLQAINVELQNARGTMPCPKQPTLRLGRGGPEDTRIYETPVFSGPKGPFIFGGFVVDPNE